MASWRSFVLAEQIERLRYGQREGWGSLTTPQCATRRPLCRLTDSHRPGCLKLESQRSVSPSFSHPLVCFSSPTKENGPAAAQPMLLNQSLPYSLVPCPYQQWSQSNSRVGPTMDWHLLCVLSESTKEDLGKKPPWPNTSRVSLAVFAWERNVSYLSFVFLKWVQLWQHDSVVFRREVPFSWGVGRGGCKLCGRGPFTQKRFFLPELRVL